METEFKEKHLEDIYGNLYTTSSELSRGGQGVVYRTKEPDIAIKQPIDPQTGNVATNANQVSYELVRTLPLPSGIPVTLPRATLKNEPGYVMTLLNGMVPLSYFDMTGSDKKELANVKHTGWLGSFPEEFKEMADNFAHYIKTGAVKDRFYYLYRTAAILARLHSVGIVYGDISTNNIFINLKNRNSAVWLIDADNLRFEPTRTYCYTPHIGAPELVQGKGECSISSDCWAFAVMSYQLLCRQHPFVGALVNEDGSDWADTDENNLSKEDQAYAGLLPFVDDEDDDSNRAESQYCSQIMFTPQLKKLYQETLGWGRTKQHRRSSMIFWAMEMARAHDESLVCEECGMSFLMNESGKCDYCDHVNPYVLAKTKRWRMVIGKNSIKGNLIELPYRLFEPFSLKDGDKPYYKGTIDFAEKKVVPQRGSLYSDDVEFEFVEV